MRKEIKNRLFKCGEFFNEFVCSVLLVIFNYALVISTSTLVYMTNDDRAIADSLSGKTMGYIYPLHQFVNCILTYPISILYRILPQIPWWYVLSQISVALGMFAIHYLIFRFARMSNFPRLAALLVAEGMDFAFFVYLVMEISFTVVPAAMGCFMLWLMVEYYNTKKKSYRIILFICFITGSTISLCHRRDSGLVVFCFYFVMLIFMELMNKATLQTLVKKMIGLLLIVFSIAFICIFVNTKVQNHINGDKFVDFNNARVDYMDYGHDTYEENPQIFKDMGWTQDTYTLAQSWHFMDDRITAESMRYISENSKMSHKAKIWSLVKQVLQNKHSVLVIIAYLITLVWTLYTLIYNFRKEALYPYLCNNMGLIILISYQLYAGRIMYRSLVIVLMLAAVINCLLALFLYTPKFKPFVKKMGVIILAICMIASIPINFNPSIQKMYDEWAESDSKVFQYVEEHSQNIYLYKNSLINARNPFNTETWENMIQTGGSSYYSYQYWSKLRNNGIDNLNGSVFEKENVYFLYRNDVKSWNELKKDAYLLAFFKELKRQYGVKGIHQVDSIPGVMCVYKFTFD